MGELTTDLRLLKWTIATGFVVLVGLVVGLYVVLFNLAARLPR